MKSFRLILLASVLLVGITSCSKDSDSSVGSITGIWEGKYGNDNDDPDTFYSLNFKSGGILEEIDQDGSVRGTGTWTIDNNNVITGYTINTKVPVGEKYSIVGAFYPSAGKVLGNWGFDDSATDGGTFELDIKK